MDDKVREHREAIIHALQEEGRPLSVKELFDSPHLVEHQSKYRLHLHTYRRHMQRLAREELVQMERERRHPKGSLTEVYWI